MAQPSQRLAPNVPGRFYVDSYCIDCDICRSLAPQFFRKDEELGLSVVYQQPRTSAEIEQALDALSSCPADAIGEEPA